MNNYIRKLIGDNWEDIKDLIVKKAEAEQKPKTIWDLKKEDGERYYYITLYGGVCDGIFNTGYDEDARGEGNAFLTREEAEFELERRTIEAIMKKYSKSFKLDSNNYCLVYSCYRNSIIIEKCGILNWGVPCFESEEKAQKVINEIGRDRLKKYWFGVTE